MKRAIVLISLLAAAPLARAQDATAAAWRDELTENYKILKNTVADQKETIDLQRKAIEKLQNDLSDLRRQMAKPAAANYASADDLKVLKDAIEDEARKRQSDEEKMLNEITKQISKLGKTTTTDGGGGSTGGGIVSAHNTGGSGSGGGSPPAARPPSRPEHVDTPPGPTGDESGFKYEVKENDNPAKIARKLYEEKGIRITPDQIMAANPQVKDPTKLYIGQQIFIPIPKSDDGK